MAITCRTIPVSRSLPAAARITSWKRAFSDTSACTSVPPTSCSKRPQLVTELFERTGIDAGGGPSGGVALEQGAQLVHVLEVGQLVRANGRAAVRGRLDEALGLQDEQRLPDRRAAETELLGELLLFQALTGFGTAVDDGLADDFSRCRARRPRKRQVRVEDAHGGDHTVCTAQFEPT